MKTDRYPFFGRGPLAFCLSPGGQGHFQPLAFQAFFSSFNFFSSSKSKLSNRLPTVRPPLARREHGIRTEAFEVAPEQPQQISARVRRTRPDGNKTRTKQRRLSPERKIRGSFHR